MTSGPVGFETRPVAGGECQRPIGIPLERHDGIGAGIVCLDKNRVPGPGPVCLDGAGLASPPGPSGTAQYRGEATATTPGAVSKVA